MSNLAFTHFHAPAPKTLADKAMLVRLKRSMFSPYAADQTATVQVEAVNGVSRAGRFNKHLLKDSTRFKRVQQKFNELYDYHVKHTVPWLDDGIRMLPADLYFDYTSEIRRIEGEAMKDLADLVVHWQAEIQADSTRLGPLFNPADYPADIAGKFGIDVQFMPVPSANDFRVTISPEDISSLDNAIREAEAEVSRYVIEQLLGPLKKMAEKLSVPIGEDGSIFRDSLVENVIEVTDRLPRLNINDDPEISRAISEVRQVVGKYAGSAMDQLRENQVARDAVKHQVDAIVAMFGGRG